MRPHANTPESTDRVVATRYRVLYADTDNMGIVNNMHYFRYFEQGRGEYLRDLGCSYATIEERGIRTPITESQARYLHPFRYDDLIRIETWMPQLKKASFAFDYRLFKEGDDTLMVAGRTVHAALNLENKVVKIPDWLIALLDPKPAKARR
ncbi:MAG: acyl-CoA thioesterase [Deltaproteobacteria bacterium]|jgi:acyl-CoA thioester hydrolase|nr:acyl-CoA thioesterase [Deltaproteobacteria bacterium]